MPVRYPPLGRSPGLLALILAATVCLLVHAPPVDADEAVTFRSRSYEITTTLDREFALEVARHMDLVHAEYARRFADFRARRTEQHPLYVFAERRQYMAHLAEHGIDGSGSAGMFFVTPGGRSGLATFLEGQGLPRMLRTLRHEGFHQFAYARIGPDLPQWANEGLAEYFAEAIVVGNRLSPGQVSPATLQGLQTAVDENDYIPFEELLHLGMGEWAQRVRTGDSRLMYDQSWSIVHFLVHASPRYQVAFEDYLAEVGRGVGAERAFDRAFGSPDYAAFERAWQQYVQQLEPTPETTAAQRLTFLGEGLRMLHDRGVEVDSVDALRDALQAGQFRMRMSLGHGVAFEMHARDEEHFQAPESDRRGADPELKLVPAEDDHLPPGLVVQGLRHTVRLDWQQGPDDEPVSRINYE